MPITFGELVQSSEGISKDANSQDITSGVKAGLGLATAAEQVEQTKMKTEEMKNDLTVKQASTVNSLLTNLARANPIVAKKMVKQVREKLIQLGADPDIADYTISEDANRQRQIAVGQLLAGKLPSDPEMAGTYFQTSTELLGWDAAAKAHDDGKRRNREDRMATNSETQTANQNTQFYAGLENQKEVARIEAGKIDAKEDKTIAKENRKEAKQLDNDLFAVDKTLSDLEALKTSLVSYSKKSIGGTGPVSTMGGLKKYADQDTENLDSKFKTVSLEQMSKLFAGMSKAVDSTAERRIFEATQPSLTLDDKTNLGLINDKIEAAKRLKEKIVNAKSGIGYAESEGVTTKAPAVAPAPGAKTSSIDENKLQLFLKKTPPENQAQLEAVLRKLRPDQYEAATNQFVKIIQQKNNTAKGRK